MKINSEIMMPELLAPAGTFEHLRAAVNAGADAVYVGGKKWGARANAGNFDDEEMQRAVDYCHLRNAKLYVTMNTLVFDDEIEPALEYARYLYEIGVDALIVQDWGLADIIKNSLPDFPLHLSTQGSIYSIEGVRAAAEHGFERVVLAREVSIADMKAIHEACGVELEVFVHGALCFCYSGQCQLSRFRGGRSGNRGMCAQPCRLPYRISQFDDKCRKEQASALPGGYEYPLSPKDLCGIDSLGDLIDAGVASLKIEGRMKSPEYVAIVVSIYRKYLDMYAAEGFYRVSEEDREKLNQVFNRGGFTKGYYYGNPGDKLMSGNIPKHLGIKIGRVVKRSKGDLVEIELDKNAELNMGDGIEIHNKEMPGNVVTYIKTLGDAKKLLIGDIRGNVNPGDEIYKITDKSLMEDASIYHALDRDGNERFVKKSPVRMEFSAYVGEPAELTVVDTSDGFILVSVVSDADVEEAINRPITIERVTEQLKKTGNSTFEAETVIVDIDDNASMPMSQINQMRREALEQLEKNKIAAAKRTVDEETWNNGIAKITDASVVSGEYPDCENAKKVSLREGRAYIYINRWDEAAEAELDLAVSELMREGCSNICPLMPLKAFMEYDGEYDYTVMENGLATLVQIIPYTSNISMGAEDAYIRENFEEIKEHILNVGCGIVCGNIGWLDEFTKAGVPARAGYGLNAANAQTSTWLGEQLGAIGIIPSLELVDAEMQSASANPQSIKATGAIPLMITEHILPETTITSRNGDEYFAVTNQYGDKSILCKSGSYTRLFVIAL